jgi:hypothetical protein
MALHAAENVGDAFSVTRDFLTPIEYSRWLKLAVVAFFVGGGMSLPSTQFNTSGSPDRIPAEEISPTLPAEVATVIAAVVAAAVGLWLIYAVVGAIMEFVFIESLRTGTVSIRKYWNRRWRQGLRLFGFRIAIGLPVVVIGLGWVALFFVPLLGGITDPIVPFSVFLLGLPVLFVVGLIYGLVSTFTTVFAVPIMVKNDAGVLAAWGPLWQSIKAEPKQYLAYAVIGFLLTIAAGLLSSIVVGIGAVVLLVPLGLLAVFVYFALSLSSTVGLVILAVLGLLFVAGIVVLWALVQVPVVSYLRFYALLVLGDIDDSFDIIPERRAALER